MNYLFDFCTKHGKVFAVFSGFLVASIASFILYFMIWGLLVLCGFYTFSEGFWGGVGCGVGTGIINCWQFARVA